MASFLVTFKNPQKSSRFLKRLGAFLYVYAGEGRMEKTTLSPYRFGAVLVVGLLEHPQTKEVTCLIQFPDENKERLNDSLREFLCFHKKRHEFDFR